MKGFSSKRRGQARERERDHTFLLTQLPREKRFGWDDLCKFHGRGSDVCGESEGFKKECVYNVKKTLSVTHSNCSLSLFFCPCGWTQHSCVHVWGAQKLWATAAVWTLRPIGIGEFFLPLLRRTLMYDHLGAIIKLRQIFPPLFRFQILPNSLPGKLLRCSASRWLKGQELGRGWWWEGGGRCLGVSSTPLSVGNCVWNLSQEVLVIHLQPGKLLL